MHHNSEKFVLYCSLCFNLLKWHFFLCLHMIGSGCLLPSLPSDAIFDSSGVSFLCDLNDNIPAPWPISSQGAASTCSKGMNKLLTFIHYVPCICDTSLCIKLVVPFLLCFNDFCLTCWNFRRQDSCTSCRSICRQG